MLVCRHIVVDYYKLKSDHFGIEIKSPTQANPTYKLKSDHHEIEMNLFFRGKY